MDERFLLFFAAVVEVIIAYQLFSHFFSRRDSNKAKLLLISAALILILAAVSLFRIYQFNTAMALLLYPLYIWLIFKCTWWQALLWSILLIMLGMVSEIASGFGVSYAFGVHIENTIIMSWYKLIVYIISKSVLFVLVRIITTMFPVHKDVGADKTSLILIAFPIFAIFNEFLLLHLTMQFNPSRETMFWGFIVGIGLIFAGFMVIIQYDRGLQKKQLEKELLLAKSKADANEKFLLLQERSLSEARSAVHDFKNQLLNLKTLYEDTDPEVSIYHNELMDSLRHQMSYQLIDVNNRVFSNIFLREQIRCEQLGIRFESQISHYDIAFIDPIDTSSIFDNAFDNAIQACSKIDEEQNRWIKYKQYKTAMFVIFEIANSYSKPILTEMGNLISSKEDKEHHGHGVKNIQATARKYGGDITYLFSDSEFQLTIRISTAQK